MPAAKFSRAARSGVRLSGDRWRRANARFRSDRGSIRQCPKTLDGSRDRRAAAYSSRHFLSAKHIHHRHSGAAARNGDQAAGRVERANPTALCNRPNRLCPRLARRVQNSRPDWKRNSFTLVPEKQTPASSSSGLKHSEGPPSSIFQQQLTQCGCPTTFQIAGTNRCSASDRPAWLKRTTTPPVLCPTSKANAGLPVATS